MNLKDRSIRRKKTMTAHKASSFKDAEKWDLLFWQKQKPSDRLSALVAIRNDITAVNPRRTNKRNAQGLIQAKKLIRKLS